MAQERMEIGRGETGVFLAWEGRGGREGSRIEHSGKQFQEDCISNLEGERRKPRGNLLVEGPLKEGTDGSSSRNG